MDHRASKLRTTLVLGTAFLAGVTIGPASSLIARNFLGNLGISTAFAQDSDRANTYRLLTLFGDAFERCGASTSILSLTRNWSRMPSMAC
jgi:hypothetical protein